MREFQGRRVILRNLFKKERVGRDNLQGQWQDKKNLVKERIRVNQDNKRVLKDRRGCQERRPRLLGLITSGKITRTNDNIFILSEAREKITCIARSHATEG